MNDLQKFTETIDPILALGVLRDKYLVMADEAYIKCFTEIPKERWTAFDSEFNFHLAIYRTSQMAIGYIKGMQNEIGQYEAGSHTEKKRDSE